MNIRCLFPAFGFNEAQLATLNKLNFTTQQVTNFVHFDCLHALAKSEYPIVVINIEHLCPNDLEIIKGKKQVWCSPDIHIAYEAWTNDALQFILYPFDQKRVVNVFSQLLEVYSNIKLPNTAGIVAPNLSNQTLPSNASETIAVPVTRGRTQVIELSKILYIQSFGSLTKFVLAAINDETDTLISTQPLGKWEEKLHKLDFIKIHKSFIVNKIHVKFYQKSKITLSNNLEIPIARRMQDDFENSYTAQSISVR
jgi:hypothetical protein